MRHNRPTTMAASNIDIDAMRQQFSGGAPDTIILDLSALCPTLSVRNELRKQLAGFILSQNSLLPLLTEWHQNGLLTPDPDNQIPTYALGRAAFALMQELGKKYGNDNGLLAGYMTALTPRPSTLENIIETEKIADIVSTITALRDTDGETQPVRIILVTPAPLIPDMEDFGLAPILKTMGLSFLRQDCVDPTSWYNEEDKATPYHPAYWEAAGYDRRATLALCRDPYLANATSAAGITTRLLATDNLSQSTFLVHPPIPVVLRTKPRPDRVTQDPLTILLDRLYGLVAEEEFAPTRPAGSNASRTTDLNAA